MALADGGGPVTYQGIAKSTDIVARRISCEPSKRNRYLLLKI